MVNRKAGAAFPFTNTIKGVIGNKTRRESLWTSIQLILSTPKGSVVYNPNLGSYVPLLVFDPLDDATKNLLTYYTVNDIQTQDPRIEISSVQITTYEDDPHRVTIWVGYIDRDDQDQKPEQAPVNFVRG